MYSHNKHLDNLIRHIELVRENCVLLGKSLIDQGRKDFGRLLIAKGFIHDHSKFFGVEWDCLHAGPDIQEDKLKDAIKQHQRSNDHHPEYWGGLDNMPEIAVAEMVCDWYARSQEFGTGLEDYIKEHAIERYNIDLGCRQYKWIEKFINLLLEKPFTSINL